MEFRMKDKPVYSSAKGDLRDKGPKSSAYQKSPGPAKMRLESNGRGGKVVTVLFNLPLEESEALAMMKELQSLLGIGGTFKNSSIELRGDHRDRVAEYFARRGLTIKRAGG